MEIEKAIEKDRMKERTMKRKRKVIQIGTYFVFETMKLIEKHENQITKPWKIWDSIQWTGKNTHSKYRTETNRRTDGQADKQCEESKGDKGSE